MARGLGGVWSSSLLLLALFFVRKSTQGPDGTGPRWRVVVVAAVAGAVLRAEEHAGPGWHGASVACGRRRCCCWRCSSCGRARRARMARGLGGVWSSSLLLLALFFVRKSTQGPDGT